jgi:GH15 family glucan-1,4-alpha-glucosidase
MTIMVFDRNRDKLYRRSIEIILDNQDEQGGYLASPNFPTYHYCWFRDGAFTAYAMDLVGESGSAARFHTWASSQINERAGLVERAIQKIKAGEPLAGSDYLHTRYTLDGREETPEDEIWPNFQLDGFGTWLWSLEQHKHFNADPLPSSWMAAGSLAARYLEALWSQPCYDCWEEFPDKVHPSTLAAIFGGLQAFFRLVGEGHPATLDAIHSRIMSDYTHEGHIVKFSGSPGVDANLLSLSIPYGIVKPDDPLMQGTVAAIEYTLQKGGGLHRYTADTYYGGGEWVLLTAWLGWYFACLGGDQSHAKSLQALEWVRAQASPEGYLPEQIPATLNDPTFYEPWLKKWGPVANPLLWSHAKYIILVESLAE